MNVEFQCRGSPIPAALTDHVRRRLHDALTHHGDVIQRILVRVGGTDGCRDHNDRYCLMQVHMSDALVATVVVIGPRVHDAIDCASDRVGRLVGAHRDQAARDRPSPASSAHPTLRQQVDTLAGVVPCGHVRARATGLHVADIRQPRRILKPRRPAWSRNRPASHS